MASDNRLTFKAVQLAMEANQVVVVKEDPVVKVVLLVLPVRAAWVVRQALWPSPIQPKDQHLIMKDREEHLEILVSKVCSFALCIFFYLNVFQKSRKCSGSVEAFLESRK